ncbi:serine hydrolase [Paenibacillus thermotolerans]|uniref:serine hydrolase n=1 Tax=Paenibacillus thermotolerans TaxID=3027807 RepID=UPI002367799A|nr:MULTISPECIES: serine hydrolase domain-containing protein [unclassified Paenibacillus]
MSDTASRCGTYKCIEGREYKYSAASVLIIQNDVIVSEWYSGRHEHSGHSRIVDAKSQFNIGSIRKTYLGFVISLALFEGSIKSLNDSVSDYLDNLSDYVIAGTTIRNLLTHTHGLHGPLKRMFPSGTDWHYYRSKHITEYEIDHFTRLPQTIKVASFCLLSRNEVEINYLVDIPTLNALLRFVE